MDRFTRTPKAGDRIVDINGKSVGSVQDVDNSYARLTTGFLGLGDTLYVPLVEIVRCEDDTCYLDIVAEQIKDRGWNERPMGRTTAQSARSGQGMTSPGIGESTDEGYGTTGTRRSGTMGQGGIPQSSGYGQQIERGDDVICRDGRSLGKVHEVGPRYIMVQKGLIFPTDLYVPMSYVENVRDRQVFVAASCEDIRNLDWSRPPAETAPRATGRGYAERETTTEQGNRTIPIREEELEVHRSRSRIGEVDVDKTVEEHKETIRVPVEREDIVITHRPVNRPSDKPVGSGEEIRVPVYGEDVEIEKETVVREEIVVEERPVVEEREVTETLRREVPHVHKSGDVGRVQDTGSTGREQPRDKTAEEIAKETTTEEPKRERRA